MNKVSYCSVFLWAVHWALHASLTLNSCSCWRLNGHIRLLCNAACYYALRFKGTPHFLSSVIKLKTTTKNWFPVFTKGFPSFGRSRVVGAFAKRPAERNVFWQDCGCVSRRARRSGWTRGGHYKKAGHSAESLSSSTSSLGLASVGILASRGRRVRGLFCFALLCHRGRNRKPTLS